MGANQGKQLAVPHDEATSDAKPMQIDMQDPDDAHKKRPLRGRRGGSSVKSSNHQEHQVKQAGSELRSCSFTTANGKSFSDDRTLPDTGATISMLPHWMLQKHDIPCRLYKPGDTRPRVKTANGSYMDCMGTVKLHVENANKARDISFIVFKAAAEDTIILS
jgi:hypothetical protein